MVIQPSSCHHLSSVTSVVRSPPLPGPRDRLCCTRNPRSARRCRCPVPPDIHYQCPFGRFSVPTQRLRSPRYGPTRSTSRGRSPTGCRCGGIHIQSGVGVVQHVFVIRWSWFRCRPGVSPVRPRGPHQIAETAIGRHEVHAHSVWPTQPWRNCLRHEQLFPGPAGTPHR